LGVSHISSPAAQQRYPRGGGAPAPREELSERGRGGGKRVGHASVTARGEVCAPPFPYPVDPSANSLKIVSVLFFECISSAASIAPLTEALPITTSVLSVVSVVPVFSPQTLLWSTTECDPQPLPYYLRHCSERWLAPFCISDTRVATVAVPAPPTGGFVARNFSNLEKRKN
jgi:hypothetical protein